MKFEPNITNTNLPNLPEAVVKFYTKKFLETFNNGVDHKKLQVTPFTFPELPDKGEAKLYLAPLQSDPEVSRVVQVNVWADWVNLPHTLSLVTAIDQDIIDSIETLAQRAIGAYNFMCKEATKQFGNGAAVAERITLWMAINDQPSVADHAHLLKGWMSFRMQYITCPQEWLSYVLR